MQFLSIPGREPEGDYVALRFIGVDIKVGELVQIGRSWFSVDYVSHLGGAPTAHLKRQSTQNLHD